MDKNVTKALALSGLLAGAAYGLSRGKKKRPRKKSRTLVFDAGVGWSHTKDHAVRWRVIRKNGKFGWEWDEISGEWDEIPGEGPGDGASDKGPIIYPSRTAAMETLISVLHLVQIRRPMVPTSIPSSDAAAGEA